MPKIKNSISYCFYIYICITIYTHIIYIAIQECFWCCCCLHCLGEVCDCSLKNISTFMFFVFVLMHTACYSYEIYFELQRRRKWKKKTVKTAKRREYNDGLDGCFVCASFVFFFFFLFSTSFLPSNVRFALTLMFWEQRFSFAFCSPLNNKHILSLLFDTTVKLTNCSEVILIALEAVTFKTQTMN